MAVPRITPLVLDCSLVVKWQLREEEYANEAIELFHDWQSGAVDVHSIDLLPSEIGSVFLRALRRGRLTEPQARLRLQHLLAIPYQLHPSPPLVLRALEIAYEHNQRIYDCFCAALAERESMALWTADERLYNALMAHFAFVRFIADYTPLR
jgi:predicted nucleic acid-binding protein